MAAALLMATSGIYDHALPTMRAFSSGRGTEATVYVVCVYLLGLLRLASNPRLSQHEIALNDLAA